MVGTCFGPVDYPLKLDVPVFPCKPWPNKGPLTLRGFKDASRDPAMIERWWQAYPDALIAMPTGTPSGFVALDIDCKGEGPNGYETLKRLGHALPETWMTITPSGGRHLWFCQGEKPLFNSASKLGPALDVRAEGGYICVPTPGSNYCWDPLFNPLELEAPAPAPEWLYPREMPPDPRPGTPPPNTDGLSRYAAAALKKACDNIARAPEGQQEITLNSEAFGIGTLAASEAMPTILARRYLLYAALRMPSYDMRRPWTHDQLASKIGRAFGDGLAYPRSRRE